VIGAHPGADPHDAGEDDQAKAEPEDGYS